jgi:sulfoxide reductase heme-binding subunit YedZ
MPSRATLQALKAAVFLLALAPLLLTGWDAAFAGLGVNPVESLLHRSGNWALRLLLLTLALTPLRQLTGANWLVRFRRMLGLYAFFYACLHFLVFVVFEHQLDPVAIWRDILQRPFILAGVVALLLLLPLAITSTDNMMRRLGRRWRQLHRAVYASAVLVLLHVFLLNKSEDYREPLLYAVVLAILLLLRLPAVRRLTLPRQLG